MTGWPQLTVSEWEETRDTLHLWMQVVGKVRLALTPMVNHWWQVPFYVSARGLTTSLMHPSDGGLEIQFDFVAHDLVIQRSDGRRRELPMRAQTVADFHQQTLGALAELGVEVTIFDRPVEIVDVVPFPDDDRHRSYDPDAAHRFWLMLVNAHRVMSGFRAGFIGKASPVHFFWGAADLATTRFSGRPAPRHPGGIPNVPDRVQELAYSHELSSCGFWPGGSEEGSFYAYAYPEPDGFSTWPGVSDPAYFDHELGEFILPYRDVRTAEDPDGLLLRFFQETYVAAAELACWPRAELEMPSVDT